MDDRAALFAHADAYPFATVITSGDGGIAVSHIPLLVDVSRGLLRGHVARGNPQLAHLAQGAEALAVFHGPHAYVSPSVYTQHPAVPTWNYVVVHAKGVARLTDLRGLRAIVDDLVARFDGTGWHLDEDPEFLGRMLGAIAGFEIEVSGIEGKWKLSQNRPAEDCARVIEWLEGADTPGTSGDERRALAALMRSWYGV